LAELRQLLIFSIFEGVLNQGKDRVITSGVTTTNTTKVLIEQADFRKKGTGSLRTYSEPGVREAQKRIQSEAETTVLIPSGICSS